MSFTRNINVSLKSKGNRMNGVIRHVGTTGVCQIDSTRILSLKEKKLGQHVQISLIDRMVCTILDNARQEETAQF